MFSYGDNFDSYTRACRIKSICAKSPTGSAIEEYLMRGVQYISVYANKIKHFSGNIDEFNHIAIKVFYVTINNILIDDRVILELVKELEQAKDAIKAKYVQISKDRGFSIDIMPDGYHWHAKYKISDILKEGERLLRKKREIFSDEYVYNLRELVIIALKGIAKYARHSKNLGFESEKIYDFFLETLYSLSIDYVSEERLSAILIDSGKIYYDSMKLFDDALISRYGEPSPSRVRITPRKGKAILVSGNNIRDLEAILKATQSKNIDVYTHGEMMLAFCYPELRQFKNLVGNYGDILLDQQMDIESFPGPVMINSDCSYDPPEVYRGRMFTTSIPFWRGVDYVSEDNFSKVVTSALDSEGFSDTPTEKFVDIDCTKGILSSYIEKMKTLFKKGKLKHIFLVSGSLLMPSFGEYMQNLLKTLPENSIIIKFSGFGYLPEEKEPGTIEGIPRFIEAGIYENFYSMLRFISFFREFLTEEEEKNLISAVIYSGQENLLPVLLSFYSFGIRNYKIGNILPYNISPGVYETFMKKFGIKIKNPSPEDEELTNLLGME